MDNVVRGRAMVFSGGTLLSGFLASPPRVVALSKPTREKMQITTARLSPWKVIPLAFTMVVSMVRPCLNRMMKARASMAATDTHSNTRVMIGPNATRRCRLRAMILAR